jgi:hypothetical protein
VTSVG